MAEQGQRKRSAGKSGGTGSARKSSGTSSAGKSAATKKSASGGARRTSKSGGSGSRGAAASRSRASATPGSSGARGTASSRSDSGSGGSARSSGSGSGASSSGGGGGSRRSSRRNGMSGREAVLRAREQVSELMSRPVESVLGMERDDDGWVITVQMVELARIPNSTDVLGDYAVTLDRDGEVIGYRRMRRYHRGQADDG